MTGVQEEPATAGAESGVDEFCKFCRDLVRVNFAAAVEASGGEWLPIMVGGKGPEFRTYMELQEPMEEHGKDAVLEAWAPIQVQVEGWTEAALLVAAWLAPLDDDIAPSAPDERREVIYLVVFVCGSKPQAWYVPVSRPAGDPPKIGRWRREANGDIVGKGYEAMQAAVNGDLPLPGEPAA
jgi:hypothetical protein